MITTRPGTADEAASALAQAAADHHRVAIRGGGTKSDWGHAIAAPDVLLSTLSLSRVIAHRHGDLTATIEAGALLDDVNRELGRHGQWIPLDPPWSDRATIGGIVASNDSGPRRHRYGAPRDLIIGVDLVRADGVRAKAGGIVVKNVAGYDLARLMAGSFGSLALITSATFKLYPVPAASHTVVADLPSYAAAGALVTALHASQLTPTAIEVHMPPLRALIRFESTVASVDAQSAAAVKLALSAGAAARLVDGEEERRVWREHADRPWAGVGSIVKVTLLPAELTAALEAIQRAAEGTPFEIAGRAGVGVLLVRLEGSTDVQRRAIGALHARVPADRGTVVVVRGTDHVDTPPGTGSAAAVMQSLRRAFDPSGLLANRRVE